MMNIKGIYYKPQYEQKKMLSVFSIAVFETIVFCLLTRFKRSPWTRKHLCFSLFMVETQVIGQLCCCYPFFTLFIISGLFCIAGMWDPSEHVHIVCCTDQLGILASMHMASSQGPFQPNSLGPELWLLDDYNVLTELFQLYAWSRC